MAIAPPPENGTLEHELHGCLDRLVDARKITEQTRQELLSEFEKLGGEDLLPLKFRNRLEELFNADADLLEARAAVLKNRRSAMDTEIAGESRQLDDTLEEEWDVVEGVARKQQELYTWSKKALVPFEERMSELQKQEDLSQHAALLDQTKKGEDSGV